jgi:hypothetical protein
VERHSQRNLSRTRLRRRLKLDDLLRGPKWEWDFLHIAEAYAARQQREGDVSLNEFAVGHGGLASALYEETREHNLVLWHGTSVERAEKILEHGFFHYRGVWMALNTSTPLGFARNRAAQSEGRPAILISVIDLDVYVPGVHFDLTNDVRFRDDVPPEVIQYVLTDRDLRFVGRGRVRKYRHAAKARFVHRDGRWVAPTQNPAIFDAQSDETYRTSNEWLDLKLRQFFAARDRATPLEAFCAVYATCNPTQAIPRDTVAQWLAANCEIRGRSRWGPLLRIPR